MALRTSVMLAFALADLDLAAVSWLGRSCPRSGRRDLSAPVKSIYRSQRSTAITQASRCLDTGPRPYPIRPSAPAWNGAPPHRCLATSKRSMSDVMRSSLLLATVSVLAPLTLSVGVALAQPTSFSGRSPQSPPPGSPPSSSARPLERAGHAGGAGRPQGARRQARREADAGAGASPTDARRRRDGRHASPGAVDRARSVGDDTRSRLRVGSHAEGAHLSLGGGSWRARSACDRLLPRRRLGDRRPEDLRRHSTLPVQAAERRRGLGRVPPCARKQVPRPARGRRARL